MGYEASGARYDRPEGWFRRCGGSGVRLPAVSLGCWQNFGDPGTDAARHEDEPSMHHHAQRLLFTAFDHGVTHFDLANNYGPAPGSAEARVGRVLREDLAGHRDELLISTKAGYRMWPGPYGDGGSRKYLLASLDQSLRRLGLEYVDFFYHHRPDATTPLEETMGALEQAVRSGKAIYAGVSNYSGSLTVDAVRTCERHGWTAPVIHQPNYSMLNRWCERELFPETERLGVGTIAFCPLAQGLLTGKYLEAIPEDSRARQASGFLKEERITPELRARLGRLNDVASARGQTLAQLALAWVVRPGAATSALIGASRPEQVAENAACLDAGPIGAEELAAIEAALGG